MTPKNNTNYKDFSFNNDIENNSNLKGQENEDVNEE